MAYLIKSAKLWNGETHDQKPTDLLIENGVITKIDQEISHPSAEVISLENLHISPAWFEPLASFGEPGFEERETIKNGALTALKSGFSGVGLVANGEPIADNKPAINFINQAFKHDLKLYPLGALTKSNDGNNLADLHDMHQAGAVAFYDTKKAIANANAFKVALQYAKSFNALLFAYPEQIDLAKKAQVHEDEHTMLLGLKSASYITETTQLKRDLDLLAYTDAHIHIPYLSCAESVEIIREAKRNQLKFTCSTSLNNLYFDTTHLAEFDSKYKIKPPLRSPKDKLALVEALIDGTIDFVSCDHEPVNEELKILEFENAAPGSIGLESCFPALNKLLGTDLAVKQLIKNWDIYQLETPKIEVNSPAQITFYNPDFELAFSKDQIHSKSKNSIFISEHLVGHVYGTLVNNSLYVNNK